MGEEGSQSVSERQWRLTPRRWLRLSGPRRPYLDQPPFVLCESRSRQPVIQRVHRRRLCPEPPDQRSQDGPLATGPGEVAGLLPILREEQGSVLIVLIHYQVVDANA